MSGAAQAAFRPPFPCGSAAFFAKEGSIQFHGTDILPDARSRVRLSADMM